MNKYSLNIACWNINGLDDNKLTDKDSFICKYAFLAHLWGAYAIPLALSSIMCRLCPP